MYALIVILSLGGKPVAVSVVPYFTTKALCETAMADVAKLNTMEMYVANMARGVCVKTGEPGTFSP